MSGIACFTRKNRDPNLFLTLGSKLKAYESYERCSRALAKNAAEEDVSLFSFCAPFVS
jgi:hypothetical protein